ncbi:hypothetical protein ANO11243_087330 [Dothideomycetidae sp. 11243]|nr:hypothetical protein ANO11243_087330 [fungal sp. No.11243]
MSLNGLESPEITEAFNSAIAEPAGWLLLKYVTRDTVDLLGSGAGGVSDARSCLAAYPDASPLYGLIMFRRKRVLIKHIPEGTSRLLQARTAVHFQGVIETFTPHDALLDISNADGLSDTALAATFPLHAGTAATNNLDEIAEDGEEPVAGSRDRQQSVSSITSRLSRKAALDRVAALKRTAMTTQVPSLPSMPDIHTASTDSDDTALERISSQLSNSEIRDEPPTTENGGHSSDRRPSLAALHQDHLSFSSEVSRFSSDTAYRESLRDMGVFEFKPKIKLAPRQVQIKQSKRASQMPAAIKRTSTMQSNFQPRGEGNSTSDVSRDSRKLSREDSENSLTPADSPMVPDGHFGTLSGQGQSEVSSQPSHSIPPRPQSSASFRSVRNSQYKAPLTPEKQRLMKAMEMRKRQQRRSQQPTSLLDSKNEKDSDSGIEMGPETENTEATPEDPALTRPQPGVTSIIDNTNADPSIVQNISVMEEAQRELLTPVPPEMTMTEHNGYNTSHSPTTPIEQPEMVPDLSGDGDDHNHFQRLERAVDSSPQSQDARHPSESHPPTTVKDSDDIDSILDHFPIADTTLERSDAPMSVLPTKSIADTEAAPEPDVRPTTPLDHFPGHTTFFRESISSQGVPPSRDGTEDDISGISEPGKTWLSDGSGTRTRSSSVDVNANTSITDSQKRKRRGIVVEHMAPIVTPTPLGVPSTEKAGSIDDDDFEYFSNATVHEALRTPVLKSRPSVIEMSSSPPSQQRISDNGVSPTRRSRASPMASTLMPHGTTTSESNSRSSFFRSYSSHSPVSQSASPEDLIVASRKSQIGSGISQRIAKLAQSRSREVSPLTSPGSLPNLAASSARRPSQRLFESRPESSRSDMEVSGMAKNQLRAFGALPPVMAPPATQPPSHPKRQSHAYYTIHKDPDTRRESVSVTARIVRPSARQEFRETPTLIHPELNVESSASSSKARESSATAANRWNRVNAKDSHLLAIGRTTRDQKAVEPVPPLPASPTKANRTSRFLKRMSGLSAVTRKLSTKPGTSLNGTIMPETETLEEAMLDPTAPSPVRIGDVNVQFPRTGLWKRRFVEIDAAGRLVFSTNEQSSLPVRHRGPISLYHASSSSKAGTRMFDMRKIAGVYVPHPDDMELANSIVLGLVGDEGDITVACEDGRGQVALLRCKHYFQFLSK